MVETGSLDAQHEAKAFKTDITRRRGDKSVVKVRIKGFHVLEQAEGVVGAGQVDHHHLEPHRIVLTKEARQRGLQGRCLVMSQHDHGDRGKMLGEGFLTGGLALPAEGIQMPTGTGQQQEHEQRPCYSQPHYHPCIHAHLHLSPD